MIDINSLRHEKEKTYLTIMQIAGGLVWLVLLIGTVGIIILWALLFALVLWLTGLYFKAVIYGGSVKVTAKQYPEIYKIIVEHSQKLNLVNVPEVFIYNGSGLVNAFASFATLPKILLHYFK